jgi:hypothetical protein
MTWQAEGSLHTARQSFALVKAPAPAPATGQVLYAIGGDSGVTAINAIGTVETFDPSTGTWTNNVTTLPGQAFTGLAAAAVNGQVHVLGGTEVGPNPSGEPTHNIFNPATASWDPVGGMALNPPRAFHVAATGTDGCIYVFGGVDAGNTPLDSVERYDPTTGLWSTAASMPHGARWGMAACVAGDNIYVIGGQSATSTALRTVELFNTKAGMWFTVSVPSLSVGRTKLAAAAGPGGLIYAIGGLDSGGNPVSDVYSWDQLTTSTWQAVAPVFPATTGRLAAALGSDGRLYVAGGNTTLADNAVTGATEAYTTSSAQPQPYITNGTGHSPDVILTDSSGNTVPVAGLPNGDTQLAPSTPYALSAHIHNDSGVVAPDTVVRFWSFPGGVGSAGILLSEVAVTIGLGVTPVNSPVPFTSAPAGQHRCAVVSLADPEAPYINVDATSAVQVPDPTIAQPTGSGHYASAWRNTDSSLVGANIRWHLNFTAETLIKDPVPVKVRVTTARVPADFAQSDLTAELRDDLRVLGATPRTPLFLAPRVRAQLEPAHELEIAVSVPKEEPERLREGEHRQLETRHEEPAHFTVHGRIPEDAKPGEVFLVDVGAQYEAGEARNIGWLQVLYVTDKLVHREYD